MLKENNISQPCGHACLYEDEDCIEIDLGVTALKQGDEIFIYGQNKQLKLFVSCANEEIKVKSLSKKPVYVYGTDKLSALHIDVASELHFDDPCVVENHLIAQAPDILFSKGFSNNGDTILVADRLTTHGHCTLGKQIKIAVNQWHVMTDLEAESGATSELKQCELPSKDHDSRIVVSGCLRVAKSVTIETTDVNWQVNQCVNEGKFIAQASQMTVGADANSPQGLVEGQINILDCTAFGDFIFNGCKVIGSQWSQQAGNLRVEGGADVALLAMDEHTPATGHFAKDSGLHLAKCSFMVRGHARLFGEFSAKKAAVLASDLYVAGKTRVSSESKIHVSGDCRLMTNSFVSSDAYWFVKNLFLGGDPDAMPAYEFDCSRVYVNGVLTALGRSNISHSVFVIENASKRLNTVFAGMAVKASYWVSSNATMISQGSELNLENNLTSIQEALYVHGNINATGEYILVDKTANFHTQKSIFSDSDLHVGKMMLSSGGENLPTVVVSAMDGDLTIGKDAEVRLDGSILQAGSMDVTGRIEVKQLQKYFDHAQRRISTLVARDNVQFANSVAVEGDSLALAAKKIMVRGDFSNLGDFHAQGDTLVVDTEFNPSGNIFLDLKTRLSISLGCSAKAGKTFQFTAPILTNFGIISGDTVHGEGLCYVSAVRQGNTIRMDYVLPIVRGWVSPRDLMAKSTWGLDDLHAYDETGAFNPSWSVSSALKCAHQLATVTRSTAELATVANFSLPATMLTAVNLFNHFENLHNNYASVTSILGKFDKKYPGAKNHFLALWQNPGLWHEKFNLLRQTANGANIKKTISQMDMQEMVSSFFALWEFCSILTKTYSRANQFFQYQQSKPDAQQDKQNPGSKSGVKKIVEMLFVRLLRHYQPAATEESITETLDAVRAVIRLFGAIQGSSYHERGLFTPGSNGVVLTSDYSSSFIVNSEARSAVCAPKIQTWTCVDVGLRGFYAGTNIQHEGATTDEAWHIGADVTLIANGPFAKKSSRQKSFACGQYTYINTSQQGLSTLRGTYGAERTNVVGGGLRWDAQTSAVNLSLDEKLIVGPDGRVLSDYKKSYISADGMDHQGEINVKALALRLTDDLVQREQSSIQADSIDRHLVKQAVVDGKEVTQQATHVLEAGAVYHAREQSGEHTGHVENHGGQYKLNNIQGQHYGNFTQTSGQSELTSKAGEFAAMSGMDFAVLGGQLTRANIQMHYAHELIAEGVENNFLGDVLTRSGVYDDASDKVWHDASAGNKQGSMIVLDGPTADSMNQITRLSGNCDVPVVVKRTGTVDFSGHSREFLDINATEHVCLQPGSEFSGEANIASKSISNATTVYVNKDATLSLTPTENYNNDGDYIGEGCFSLDLTSLPNPQDTNFNCHTDFQNYDGADPETLGKLEGLRHVVQTTINPSDPADRRFLRWREQQDMDAIAGDNVFENNYQGYMWANTVLAFKLHKIKKTVNNPKLAKALSDLAALNNIVAEPRLRSSRRGRGRSYANEPRRQAYLDQRNELIQHIKDEFSDSDLDGLPTILIDDFSYTTPPVVAKKGLTVGGPALDADRYLTGPLLEQYPQRGLGLHGRDVELPPNAHNHEFFDIESHGPVTAIGLTAPMIDLTSRSALSVDGKNPTIATDMLSLHAHDAPVDIRQIAQAGRLLAVKQTGENTLPFTIRHHAKLIGGSGVTVESEDKKPMTIGLHVSAQSMHLEGSAAIELTAGADGVMVLYALNADAIAHETHRIEQVPVSRGNNIKAIIERAWRGIRKTVGGVHNVQTEQRASVGSLGSDGAFLYISTLNKAGFNTLEATNILNVGFSAENSIIVSTFPLKNYTTRKGWLTKNKNKGQQAFSERGLAEGEISMKSGTGKTLDLRGMVAYADRLKLKAPGGQVLLGSAVKANSKNVKTIEIGLFVGNVNVSKAIFNVVSKVTSGHSPMTEIKDTLIALAKENPAIGAIINTIGSKTLAEKIVNGSGAGIHSANEIQKIITSIANDDLKGYFKGTPLQLKVVYSKHKVSNESIDRSQGMYANEISIVADTLVMRGANLGVPGVTNLTTDVRNIQADAESTSYSEHMTGASAGAGFDSASASGSFSMVDQINYHASEIGADQWTNQSPVSLEGCVRVTGNTLSEGSKFTLAVESQADEAKRLDGSANGSVQYNVSSCGGSIMAGKGDSRQVNDGLAYFHVKDGEGASFEGKLKGASLDAPGATVSEDLILEPVEEHDYYLAVGVSGSASLKDKAQSLPSSTDDDQPLFDTFGVPVSHHHSKSRLESRVYTGPSEDSDHPRLPERVETKGNRFNATIVVPVPNSKAFKKLRDGCKTVFTPEGRKQKRIENALETIPRSKLIRMTQEELTALVGRVNIQYVMDASDQQMLSDLKEAIHDAANDCGEFFKGVMQFTGDSILRSMPSGLVTNEALRNMQQDAEARDLSGKLVDSIIGYATWGAQTSFDGTVCQATWLVNQCGIHPQWLENISQPPRQRLTELSKNVENSVEQLRALPEREKFKWIVRQTASLVIMRGVSKGISWANRGATVLTGNYILPRVFKIPAKINIHGKNLFSCVHDGKFIIFSRYAKHNVVRGWCNLAPTMRAARPLPVPAACYPGNPRPSGFSGRTQFVRSARFARQCENAIYQVKPRWVRSEATRSLRGRRVMVDLSREVWSDPYLRIRAGHLLASDGAIMVYDDLAPQAPAYFFSYLTEINPEVNHLLKVFKQAGDSIKVRIHCHGAEQSLVTRKKGFVRFDTKDRCDMHLYFGGQWYNTIFPVFTHEAGHVIAQAILGSIDVVAKNALKQSFVDMYRLASQPDTVFSAQQQIIFDDIFTRSIEGNSSVQGMLQATSLSELVQIDDAILSEVWANWTEAVCKYGRGYVSTVVGSLHFRLIDLELAFEASYKNPMTQHLGDTFARLFKSSVRRQTQAVPNLPRIQEIADMAHAGLSSTAGLFAHTFSSPVATAQVEVSFINELFMPAYKPCWKGKSLNYDGKRAHYAEIVRDGIVTQRVVFHHTQPDIIKILYAILPDGEILLSTGLKHNQGLPSFETHADMLKGRAAIQAGELYVSTHVPDVVVSGHNYCVDVEIDAAQVISGIAPASVLKTVLYSNGYRGHVAKAGFINVNDLMPHELDLLFHHQRSFRRSAPVIQDFFQSNDRAITAQHPTLSALPTATHLAIPTTPMVCNLGFLTPKKAALPSIELTGDHITLPDGRNGFSIGLSFLTGQKAVGHSVNGYCFYSPKDMRGNVTIKKVMEVLTKDLDPVLYSLSKQLMYDLNPPAGYTPRCDNLKLSLFTDAWQNCHANGLYQPDKQYGMQHLMVNMCSDGGDGLIRARAGTILHEYAHAATTLGSREAFDKAYQRANIKIRTHTMAEGKNATEVKTIAVPSFSKDYQKYLALRRAYKQDQPSLKKHRADAVEELSKQHEAKTGETFNLGAYNIDTLPHEAKLIIPLTLINVLEISLGIYEMEIERSLIRKLTEAELEKLILQTNCEEGFAHSIGLITAFGYDEFSKYAPTIAPIVKADLECMAERFEQEISTLGSSMGL